MRFVGLARPVPTAIALAISALHAGCTTGSTFRSGVGDTFLERPPYYAGTAASADTTRVGHFPIAYQRGGSQPAAFDPAGGAGTPIASFLAEMNAYLDSLRLTTRVGPVTALTGTPPDVQFGCETDASGDCAERAESQALGRKGTLVKKLAVGRPSNEWVSAARAAMEGANVPSALVITLEVGQHFTRQSGLRGDKSVELGTGYTVELPWLTSVETPVSVLQLTGARVGHDGRAIRIGAEGLLARRTSVPVSALGAQALITNEDVERARAVRREDLPGQPLAWREALRNLVVGLAGSR